MSRTFTLKECYENNRTVFVATIADCVTLPDDEYEVDEYEVEYGYINPRYSMTTLYESRNYAGCETYRPVDYETFEDFRDDFMLGNAECGATGFNEYCVLWESTETQDYETGAIWIYYRHAFTKVHNPASHSYDRWEEWTVTE